PNAVGQATHLTPSARWACASSARSPPERKDTVSMSSLARIERGRRPMPPRLMVFGPEGIGKSTLGAQTPKPIFVQTEDGLGQIDADRFPLASTYHEVVRALQDLHEQEHEYETVVIDSIDWLERLLWDEICAQVGVN